MENSVNGIERKMKSREIQTSRGMKIEKHNRRKISKMPMPRLEVSQLLALHAAGNDTSSMISITILHVSGVSHVDLLRRVTN